MMFSHSPSIFSFFDSYLFHRSMKRADLPRQYGRRLNKFG